MVAFHVVRILLDYRPALRARSGVGEFIHELARALVHEPPAKDLDLRLFSSSWKDRPAPALAAELPGVRVIDRKIPVQVLSWAWNNAGWPPIESLAGPCDVAHAAGPLLVPTRRAAQVITVHDLDFLHHPERTTAEIRRDFARRIHEHARRADHVVVSSHYAAGEVTRALDVPPDQVSVCSPGAPAWAADVAASRAHSAPGSSILFVGTLEPRKNISGLLAAYRALVAARPASPRLVIAGRVPASAAAELARADEGPVRGRIEVLGYVAANDKPRLYEEARMLVLPSLEEGFGLPVLEAMACGVPVVVSNRGALPEVAGDAAEPVDPTDTAGLAQRMMALLEDRPAQDAAARGLARAAHYSWTACAAAVYRAYVAALERRRRRS
jgi:glycosyltransferase involved in cell wall biosynthesis